MMALFGVSFARREAPIRGEGVYLRPCQMRDFAEWAALREKSRAFLTPWEPLWPHDDLTRMAFRYRVRRHAEEAARDESYSFLIFREEEAGGKQEPAIALNVSKLGACIATTRVSKAGETIWVQWPHNTQRAFARVVWAKRLAASQYLIGIEILDCENFWELEGTTPAAS